MKYLPGGFLFFLLLTGCMFAQDIPPDSYVIGEEDVLAVNVWKEPELSISELVVRPDGKISLPLVNDIQAGGKTPVQLQEHIAQALMKYITEPNVTVTVIRAYSHTVSVVGQVIRPGVYIMGSPTTVLDILARVGGLNPQARDKDIRIVRNEDGKIHQFPFNYRNVIRGRNLQQNIYLKSGDIVMVP
ncbi:MAG TPA: polysaccharide biosynthesis/export family protein [Acidobacteriota bacterium]|nr:polysaccharide biosynthesis/export family protein [Acidobacteriota bacterium]